MARPIVYGPAISTYVWSVRLALAEKGIAHDLSDVPMSEIGGAAHRVRHPFGKVPAFEHDGFALYETQAILRYVDEAFPSAPLQPIEVHPFSRMNQIMGIVDAYLWPSLVPSILDPRLAAPRQGRAPDEAAVAKALTEVKLCLSEIARLADGQPFLAGDRVSLADLLAIPLILYFRTQPEGRDQLGGLPELATWAGRMEQRQSLQVTRPPGV